MPGGTVFRGVITVATRGRWVPFYDPARDPIRILAMQHRVFYQRVELWFWLMALAFLISDAITTLIGFSHPGISESVAVTRVALEFGWIGIAVKKTIVITLILGCWLVLPRPYRLVIPITAAITGFITVRNNVTVLLHHGYVPLF